MKCIDRLSNSVSKSLKGISAVEIMIGHLGIATGYLLLYPSRKAGILFVGIFFMLSGYGLMHNTIHDQNYLKNFLLKRELLIFVPAYAIYLLRGIIKLIQIRTVNI